MMDNMLDMCIDMGGRLPFVVRIDAGELHIDYDFSAIKSEKLQQFLRDNLVVEHCPPTHYCPPNSYCPPPTPSRKGRGQRVQLQTTEREQRIVPINDYKQYINQEKSLLPTILSNETRTPPLPLREGAGGRAKIATYATYQPYPLRMKIFARHMRNNPTEAEQKLWQLLKNKQTGHKFRRKHNIDGKYIADFICLEQRLIIEIDPEQHFENTDDNIRTSYIESHNFRIMRFWHNEILQNIDSCYEMILLELEKSQAKLCYIIKLKQNNLIEFVIEDNAPPRITCGSSSLGSATPPQGGSNPVAPFFPKITITSPYYMRLGVMELRMLAQNDDCAAPYSRIDLSQTHQWHIKTDLHTHLTSQIKSSDLLEIARTHDASYPAELMELIGINTSQYAATMTPSTAFSPAAQDGLTCEQHGNMVAGVALGQLNHDDATKLQQSMEIAIDEVISFDELERRIYRFRNPLTKNPHLIAATISRIADDYALAGVEYAELAVTAALNPDWLEAALPALQAAQQRGVTLKLLIGLPRSLPPSQILAQLKMVMFAASHPAIIGVDFLGYEANKTRNFAWALSHFARFAATNQQTHDFIIRVHAGENGKNPDNVLEVLQIADKFGVRVRVGHATYGDADSCLALAQSLAKQGLLIMEFNPDSNLAMNNIDCATDIPISKWAQAGIPFVLASDGAGVYQTNAAQLFNAGIFAGLAEAELSLMMQTEVAHIARQQALCQRKQISFNADYGDDANFIAQMREFQAGLAQQQQHFNFNGKIPLLIAGASGSSWKRISHTHQAEIRAGIAKLVATLDANKVAFVVGRIKPEGIGKVLEDALDAHYAHYASTPNAPQFDVVGLLSQQQNMPLIANHINHILPLHGELMSVPTQVTNLLKSHNGLAIYIGGSAFTRDFILCSQKLGVPFAVMVGVAGASGEKARILPNDNVFNSADEMVNLVVNWVMKLP